MTKKIINIGSLLVAVAFCVAFEGNNNQVQKSDGGPPYNTNAPGDKTCSGSEGANNCHSGGIPDNSGPGTPSILFSGGTVYVPGQTYTITPKIFHSTRNRFGFQIVSLKDSTNTFIGTPILIDTNVTRMQQPTWGTGQDRIYVMHRLAGSYPSIANTGEWTYKWTAPLTNVGNISFYACYNAANNNNTNDPGDQTYWAKITISPSAVGIADINGNNPSITVYPNPAQDFVNLEYIFDKPTFIKADLINIEGKLIQQLIQEHQVSGKYVEKIIFNNVVSSGTYFIRSTIAGREFLKKILIETNRT
jgi:hypothetical protein